jgi:hypothetical protein
LALRNTFTLTLHASLALSLSLSLSLPPPLSLSLKRHTHTHTHTHTQPPMALLPAFDFEVAGSIVDHCACANDAATVDVIFCYGPFRKRTPLLFQPFPSQFRVYRRYFGPAMQNTTTVKQVPWGQAAYSELRSSCMECTGVMYWGQAAYSVLESCTGSSCIECTGVMYWCQAA